jgi:hypothetical protein
MAAKVVPGPGETVKTTTFQEVLASAVPQKERESLPFWDYIASLKPEEYGRHIAYVYRWLENGDTAASAKLTLPFDEFGLKEAVGGGSFRIILKNGAQIVKRIEKVVIEGKPKNPDDAPAASIVQSGSRGELSELVLVMNRQTDLLERVLARQDRSPLVEEGVRSAIGLQADVFRTGVEAVRGTLTATSPAPSANPLDELTRTFLQAAITKMLNPADPIEAFSKMATAFSALNLGGGGSPNIGVEIVKQIGSALPHIAQFGITYTQAQLELARAHNAGRTINVSAQPATTAAPAAGQPPPIRANADDNRNAGTALPAAAATSSAPSPGASSSTAASPAPPPQGGDVQPPNLEWVEQKIAQIIMNQELSVSEAASEAMTYLQIEAPNVLKQIGSDQSGRTIEWLFANRPILMQVPKNPRLTEFTAKFLELYAQSEAEQPALPEPPPPSA